MRTAQLTHDELNSALRQAGCAYAGTKHGIAGKKPSGSAHH